MHGRSVEGQNRRMNSDRQDACTSRGAKEGVGRWLRFIVANAAFGAAVYGGCVLNIDWVGWIASGIVWSMLCLYVLIARDADISSEARRRVLPISDWIAWPVDLVFVAVFLRFGWYLTAVAYAASCVVLRSIYRCHEPTQGRW